MGILIMQNTRQICNTTVTTEQYLQEQIEKGNGWVGGHFHEDNTDRSWQYAADSWTNMAQNDLMIGK